MAKQTSVWLALSLFGVGVASPPRVEAGVPLWEREGFWVMGPRPVDGESPFPCWPQSTNFWMFETVVENTLAPFLSLRCP